MTSDQLCDAYIGEHRILRNLFFDLTEGLRIESGDRIQELLRRAISWAGPRLRYHEESVYPIIQHLTGHAEIRALMEEHDRMISILEVIQGLVTACPLSADDRLEAAALVKSLIPGLTRSFGLSLMFSLLPEDSVKNILDSRSQSIQDGIGLLDWRRTRRPGKTAILGSDARPESAMNMPEATLRPEPRLPPVVSPIDPIRFTPVLCSARRGM